METIDLLLKLWPILIGLVAVSIYVVTLKIRIDNIQESRAEFRNDYQTDQNDIKNSARDQENRIVELEKWQREEETKMENVKELVAAHRESTVSHFVLLKQQVADFSKEITKRVDEAVKDIGRQN